MTGLRALYAQQSRAMLDRINYAISNANRSLNYSRAGGKKNPETINTPYEFLNYLARLGALGSEVRITLLDNLSRNPEQPKYIPDTDIVSQNGTYAENRREEIRQFPQATSPAPNQQSSSQGGQNKKYNYGKYNSAKSQIQKVYHSMIEAFKRLRQGVYNQKENGNAVPVLYGSTEAAQEKTTDNIAAKVVDIRTYKKPINPSSTQIQYPIQAGGLEKKLERAA